MATTLSTSTPASTISSADFARSDGQIGGETDVPSMDDILRNSPAAKLLGLKEEAQTEDAEDALTQDEESEGADPASEDESENETDSKDDEEEVTEKDDEESTPEGELPSEEEIEWTYKIPVKIDGKEQHLTLEEVRKGYATAQHLSAEGRKLGELKKQVETERTEKLQEVIQLGSILNQEMTRAEDALQTEYNKITAEIDKARDDGDTYAARELKDKREGVQEQYWKTRNNREAGAKAIAEQWQSQQQEQQKEQLKKFHAEVKDKIPDFSEKVALSIRDFAIKEGVPEALLDILYDVNAVRFINDYRKLKTAKDRGEVKRKEAPAAKSVPSKKGTPISQREAASAQSQRSKVLSGQGNKSDEMDFLKRISSIGRKL